MHNQHTAQNSAQKKSKFHQGTTKLLLLLPLLPLLLPLLLLPPLLLLLLLPSHLRLAATESGVLLCNEKTMNHKSLASHINLSTK